MKKFLCLFLSVVTAIGVFFSVPVSASGQIGEWDIYFSLNESGTAYEVEGCYQFASGTLNIPESYDSLPVIGIKENAFYFHNGITEVVLPNTIKYIEKSAFAGCSNLETVELGGVKTIGYQAFVGCDNLTYIELPQSVVSIDGYAFADCVKLKNITIGNNVKKIGAGVFNNTALYKTTSNWSNNVLYVDNCLIEAKKSVRKLDVIEGTVIIADSALIAADGLREIIIPDSVSNIGENAFGNGSGLNYTFYKGSSDSWNEISVLKGNTRLLSSAIHYGTDTHIYSTDWTVDAEPTCIYEGEKSRHCTQCDSRIDIVSIGCTDHTESYWITEKKGTVYAPGLKYIECTVCKEVLETETLPQLKPATVRLGKAATTSTGIKITWSKVTGADKYTVYRKSGTGSYKAIKTVTGTSYTDTTAKSGTKYTYTVKAKNEAGYGSYNKTGISKLFLATPKVTVANASSGVTVKWNKITGAKGYYVYRKLSGSDSWTKIATVKSGTTVSYTDKKASAGKKYYYTVKAYNGDYVSTTKASSVIERLKAPTIKTVTSAKSGVTVKWAKSTGADGYYVYRKTGSGSYTKIATVKGNTKVSYLDKSAKKGKTYTYYVKAYSGKSVSTSSKTLKIKDKY